MLVVERVSKRYGGLSVLDDISFEVQQGEFVSLVGASGIGKTTLLKIVAGLEPATAGQVWLSGRVVTGPPPELIFVFQDYSRSLLPWRTVLGNVTFGLEHRDGQDSQVRMAKARQVLALTGLSDFECYYPWQLSGGMQQRVAIARALACEPAVLLMDEPFGSLDALTRSDLEDHLLRLWSVLGKTILFVTHDIDEAVYLSDRVLVLKGRPARLAGTVEVDLPRPRHPLSTREDARFLACRHRLFKLIQKEGLP
ncbi:MAG: ABC transporter ATP-binding protein [Anaerolineae bacterium]